MTRWLTKIGLAGRLGLSLVLPFKALAASTSIGPVSVINTGFSGGEQRAEVSGKVLCVSGNSTVVKFYNLTNPAAPVLIGSANVPGITHAISHFNGFFYLAGDGWLTTFSCPSNSAVVNHGTFTDFLSPVHNGSRIKIHNGHLFLSTYVDGLTAPGEVWIFTLNDPAAPAYVSTAVGPAGSGMADLALRGNVLYVCGYFDRQIHVFDISDLQNPRLVHTQAATGHGDYALFEPWRMLIHGDALYVQDDNTWQIFNINNSTNPVFASALQVEKDIEGSRLVGDTLMWSASGVSQGTAGVLLYDCRNPFSPTFFCRTNIGSFNGYYWGDMDDSLIYHPQFSAVHIFSRPPLPLPAPVPEPVNFSAVTVSPVAVNFTWYAPTSATFHIEWSGTLTPPAWNQIASTFTSTNGAFSFIDNGSQTAPLGPIRFYRLAQP